MSPTAPERSDSATSTSSGSQPPKAEMAPVSRETRPTIVGGEAPEEPYPIHLEGAITRGFGRGARFLGIPTANLPDSSLDPLNQLGLTGIFFGFARIHPSSDTSASASASGLGSSSQVQLGSDPASESGPSTPSANGVTANPLDADAISALPAHTAPYPANSIPSSEGVAQPKTRLMAKDAKVWPMVMSVGYNPYFKNEKVTAEVHIIHSFQNDFYAHDMSVLVLGYIRPELDYVSKEALINDINIDVKVALNSLARPEWAKYSTHPFLVERRGASAGFGA